MYKIDQLKEIDLGVAQENDATQIEIDVRPWLSKWPDGVLTVNVCRPGEMEPYPALCRVEDGILIWSVKESDLAIAGHGRCDIRLYQNTVRKKTQIAITIIHDTLPSSETDEPPAAAQGWLDTLNQTRIEVDENAAAASAAAESAKESQTSAAESAESALASREAAAQSAETALDAADEATNRAEFLEERSAVWIGNEAPAEGGYDVWVNPDGAESVLRVLKNNEWVDIPALKGADGVSPAVSIAESSTSVTITITDATGSHIASIPKSSGDMQKSVYDANNDGIVDNAEKLGGQLPSAYRKAADPINYQTDVTNKPTIDTAVTAGSANAVTGEAVKTYVDGMEKSNGVTITVPASAWTGAEAPYTATVDCSVATASNLLAVSPAGQANSAEQRAAIAAAMITATGQGAGTITLTADGDKPEMAVAINVVEVI